MPTPNHFPQQEKKTCRKGCWPNYIENIIFHQPQFDWNKGNSHFPFPKKLPFLGTPKTRVFVIQSWSWSCRSLQVSSLDHQRRTPKSRHLFEKKKTNLFEDWRCQLKRDFLILFVFGMMFIVPVELCISRCCVDLEPNLLHLVYPGPNIQKSPINRFTTISASRDWCPVSRATNFCCLTSLCERSACSCFCSHSTCQEKSMNHYFHHLPCSETNGKWFPKPWE